MLAPIRSAMIGMFTGPIAGLALGAAASGGSAVWAMVCGVGPLVLFGVRLAVLLGQRRGLVERLKACRWRACTACGRELGRGSVACGACGLAITPDEAERAWMRSRWAL